MRYRLCNTASDGKERFDNEEHFLTASLFATAKRPLASEDPKPTKVRILSASADDVEVTGVLCCKWKPVMKGVRCDLEMVILANNIR